MLLSAVALRHILAQHSGAHFLPGKQISPLSPLLDIRPGNDSAVYRWLYLIRHALVVANMRMTVLSFGGPASFLFP